MDVGKRIKQLREAKGLTINKLANMAGLSQSFLRDVELGNKNPTVETLSYFCNALEISLADFFNDTENNINTYLKSSISKLSDLQQMRLAEFINEMQK